MIVNYIELFCQWIFCCHEGFLFVRPSVEVTELLTRKSIAKVDYLTFQGDYKDYRFVKEKIIWVWRFIFLASVILWLKSNVLTVEVFLLILSFSNISEPFLHL